MSENQPFRQGLRGCFFSLFSIGLAILALAVSTVHHYPEHPSCRGMLGAGFPALFICDDWGGGSPTGSWEKIDFIDVLNGGIRPGGFLIDFLFYITLILIVWLIASRLIRTHTPRRNVWLATFITLGFVSGFLFAFLAIQSSDLYIKHPPLGTPTPVLSTATSPGTVQVEETPEATISP